MLYDPFTMLATTPAGCGTGGLPWDIPGHTKVQSKYQSWKKTTRAIPKLEKNNKLDIIQLHLINVIIYTCI